MPFTIFHPFFSHPRPAARLYHSTASVWLSVDPLSDKYPNVSPYVYCANNPVRLVDPDGREIVDGQGNICYTQKDGWLPNAPEDTKRIGNALLETRTGKEQFDKLVNSETKIQLTISSETINSKEEGVTFGTFAYDISQRNTYTDEAGYVHIKSGIITIYEGSVASYLNGTGACNVYNSRPTMEALGAMNATPLQYMAAVCGHEIEHATSLVNIQLHYNKQNAELFPNYIKESILWDNLLKNN